MTTYRLNLCARNKLVLHRTSWAKEPRVRRMCCEFKKKTKRNSNEFNFPVCEDTGLFPSYTNQYNQKGLKN